MGMIALIEHVFYLLDADDSGIVGVPNGAREANEFGNVFFV
jgi:hypothetical protein